MINTYCHLEGNLKNKALAEIENFANKMITDNNIKINSIHFEWKTISAGHIIGNLSEQINNITLRYEV